MGAVTVGAVGRILLFLIVSLSVAADKILVKNFGMTGGTVHWFVGGAGALQVVAYFSMALGTLDVLVYRIGKFKGIYKERNGIPIYHTVEVLIVVAFPAGIIRCSGLDHWYIHNVWRVAAGTGRNDGGILFP